jgi:hypothetical protein
MQLPARYGSFAQANPAGADTSVLKREEKV